NGYATGTRGRGRGTAPAPPERGSTGICSRRRSRGLTDPVLVPVLDLDARAPPARGFTADMERVIDIPIARVPPARVHPVNRSTQDPGRPAPDRVGARRARHGRPGTVRALAQPGLRNPHRMAKAMALASQFS